MLLFHSYIFYPISVYLVSILWNRKYKTRENYFPKVSIVISAYNEEKVIEITIRNFLKSDYDLNKIEFVIGSDDSSDSTNSILSTLQTEIPNIKFFPFTNRRGKSCVLNDLVKTCSSEIVIFADANTMYHPKAIKNLVKFYADERVGGVSGKLVLLDFSESIKSGSQEIKYWNFETWLKEREGKIGKLVGANGGIYSLRKELFAEIPTEIPVVDDFYLSLKVLELKKDFLYASEAKAEELTAPTLISEFKRKIRGNANNLSTIKPLKRLLSPSYGFVAYALWSHKIIRWFTPLLLLFMLISNIFLYNGAEFFMYFLIIQILFYSLGLIGYILILLKLRIQPFLIIFYFLLTNAALFIGLFQFLFKKNTAYWQSTPRL